jgi:hypothetical protein
MSFRVYLAIMAAATLLSWAAWVFVMFNTNPDESSAMGFVLFYVTLFMGVVGLLTLVGTGYRVFVLKRGEALFRDIRVSFRHAVLMGLIAVIALALTAHAQFRWWTIPALIVGVTIVEYLFLVREEGKRS